MKRFCSTIACSLAIAVWWGAPSPAWADLCKEPSATCKKDSQCCAGLICGGGRCVPKCRIDGVVYAPGDTNGACKSCDPSVSTTSFSTSSSDGTTCTGNDDFCQTPPFVCADGACVGKQRDCSVGAPTCITKSCNSTLRQCEFEPVVCPPVPVEISQCYFTACDIVRGFCVQQCLSGGCNDGGLGLCSNVPGCVAGVCETVFGPMGQPVQRCSNDTATPCNDDGDCSAHLQCRDNDPCTRDVCDPRGLCTWTPETCFDGDVCTTDFCDAALGCQNTPSGTSCDDGIPCTRDRCVNDECIHTKDSCDDGDPCTVDACGGGVCRQTLPPVLGRAAVYRRILCAGVVYVERRLLVVLGGDVYEQRLRGFLFQRCPVPPSVRNGVDVPTAPRRLWLPTLRRMRRPRSVHHGPVQREEERRALLLARLQQLQRLTWA